MKHLLVALMFVCNTAFAETLAIVNVALHIGQISREDARALYLMKERRWDDGQIVILYQLPTNSKLHRAFVRDVLGMSNEQYNREWDRLVNAGLSTYIHSVSSQQEMIRRVANTANALGYIDSDHMIINTGERDITTLRITN